MAEYNLLMKKIMSPYEGGPLLFQKPFWRRDVKGALSGQVAQLVEQRTENPCVGGSIPSLTTACLACFANSLLVAPNAPHQFGAKRLEVVLFG